MRNYFLFFFLLISRLIFSQTGTWNWAKEGASEGSALAKDLEGNIYSTGISYSPSIILFGYPTFSGTGICNSWIAKSQSNGNTLWAKALGGDYYVRTTSIAVDENKNVFVCGYFEGDSLIADSFRLYNSNPSSNPKNFFMVKLDSLGNYLWVKGGNCIYDNYANEIRTDKNGYVYLDGVYAFTSLTIDSITLSAPFVEDIFIAKYTTNGDVVWVKHFEGSSYDKSESMCYDGLNSLYITGQYGSGFSIDGHVLTGTASFITKIDLSGNLIWLKKHEGALTSIAANTAGDIAIGGYIYGTKIYDSDTLISNGSGDFFVAKLDSLSNYVWAKNIGGSANDYCTSVTIDNSGSIFLCGHFFSPTITIMGLNYINAVGSSGVPSDILYIKYDSMGNIQLVNEVGGSGADRSLEIVFDETIGSLYSVGLYESHSMLFGAYNLYAAGTGAPKVFLSRLDIPVLSILEFSDNSNLKVSPNPFFDELLFHLENYTLGKKYKMEIIDIVGNVIYESEFSSSIGRICLGSEVKSGVYFLRAIYDEGYICKRIVKT